METESIILIFLIVFLLILGDFFIRSQMRKSKTRKNTEKREEVLKQAQHISFSPETPSFRRVDTPDAQARILCIDDDPVILDSLRKILVLDGYAVDTVESGKEALSVLHYFHYDFAFVDLKMPEIDGTTLTRHIRNIRPDIDVIILTGYATIESAVELMGIGVLDYVQKPFSADELLALIKKALKKRQNRIHDLLAPKVHVGSVDEFVKHSVTSFIIPGGVFISQAHCWVSLLQDGSAQIGIDDFAKRVIGPVEKIEFPNLGMQVSRNQPLFVITSSSGKYIPFVSPLAGEVIKINKKLVSDTGLLEQTTYSYNWLCCIQASAIDLDIAELKIGQSAVDFYKKEIEQCQSHLKQVKSDKKNAEALSDGNGSLLERMKHLSDKQRENLIKKLFPHGQNG